jgi:hypothetical protein
MLTFLATHSILWPVHIGKRFDETDTAEAAVTGAFIALDTDGIAVDVVDRSGGAVCFVTFGA